jgi:F420-dependent oxidoreductase-like protein
VKLYTLRRVRVCLMIEGQEDVTWEQWQAIASTAESAGIEALFRSDHYASVMGAAGRGSLDAWSTIAGLAAVTSRIRLGTLVSPGTFRHPSLLAKSVVTADHISGGRVELGVGAGWLEAEHRAYGFPFYDTRTRMAIFREQIEIVHGSWKPGPFSFEGEHYTVEELDALPKPLQQPHPTLIVGGSGGRGTIGPAARWADEYNTFSASPDEIRERRARFAEAWEREGRDPAELRFSAMVTIVVSGDESLVRERTGMLAGDLAERSVSGSVDQVAGRLRELEEAGAQRVMLQHLWHTDLDTIELIGRELAPRLS